MEQVREERRNRVRDKKAREEREKEGKNEREEEISERKRKESEIREREESAEKGLPNVQFGLWICRYTVDAIGAVKVKVASGNKRMTVCKTKGGLIDLSQTCRHG